jgi:hypothetical protein
MNSPYIPCWMGYEPIRYWISPEMQFCRSLIRLALDTWARERLPDGLPLRLRFEEIGTPDQPRSIDCRLEPLVGNLGIAMFPPSLIIETQAGNVTINANCNWRDPRWYELLLALLIHEIGHALGLPESYLPESVMCPNIDCRKVNLARVDRDTITTLYGS